MKNVLLLTGLWAVAPAFVALAQNLPSQPTLNQRIAPPVSKTRREVDHLMAMTKVGYYTRPNGLRTTAKTAIKVSTDDCARACILLLTSPLPVTLIGFTGQRLDATQVQLEWRTSVETHNDHFAIQRSGNPATGFETIGTVRGQGSSSQTTNYQFTDANTATGYTYYQLKQVDLDGTTSYSKIVAVKGVVSVLAVSVFPNPGEARQISFQLSGIQRGEAFSVALYDLQGRTVYQQANATVNDDMLMQFPASVNLSPGTYVLGVKTSNQQTTRSFIIRP